MNKYYKIRILLLLLLCSISALGQKIYIKDKNETIESFIDKNFPETRDNIVHKIIQGKWGDTSYAYKIVVFYRAANSDGSGATALVLQSISANRYKRLQFDYTLGIGVYPNTSTIESVFFYDTDGDGLKELVVIGQGVVRCLAEVIEFNEETQKEDTLTMSASCENCGYKVFQQKHNSEIIEEIDSDESDEWECDFATIKAILEDRKSINKGN